jgi:hypothetical protein
MVVSEVVQSSSYEYLKRKKDYRLVFKDLQKKPVQDRFIEYYLENVLTQGISYSAAIRCFHRTLQNCYMTQHILF